MEEVEKKVEKKKIEKYDRQLRLWGAHGQAALENAHVCLLNASATGTEILKNLVLPGIGSFTIIDSHKVQQSDLGNNFFITVKGLGQSRAKVTEELLQELNDPEWVKGHYRDEDPIELINSKIDTFKQYSLVIATGIPEDSLKILAKYLYEQNIPLVIARAYGFIGYLRLVVPEHSIYESKPDNAKDDLRLSNPFPELKKCAEEFDFRLKDEGGVLDSHLHAHIPYPIILLKSIASWKAAHEGKLPSDNTSKDAYKKAIMELSTGEETNFDEAIAAAWKTWSEYEISPEVQTILDDDKATNLNASSSNFWIIANAIKQFVAKEQTLPLLGSIPDMTADTNGYMKLQELYGNKSKTDIDAVKATVAANLKALGRNADSVSEEEIVRACKNSPFWNLVRMRSIEQEYSVDSEISSRLDDSLDDPTDNSAWYIILRAVDRFHAQHKRYPGQNDDQVEGDAALLKEIVTKFQTEIGLTKSVPDDLIPEITRAGGAELHNIGAILGGIGAQEIIKLITHQWVPFNNTFIFNGMNCTSTTTVF